jgi:hypothetical protein
VQTFRGIVQIVIQAPNLAYMSIWVYYLKKGRWPLENSNMAAIIGHFPKWPPLNCTFPYKMRPGGRISIMLVSNSTNITMGSSNLQKQRSIGTLRKDSGWTGSLVEAGVASPGMAESFLSASSITKTRQNTSDNSM